MAGDRCYDDSSLMNMSNTKYFIGSFLIVVAVLVVVLVLLNQSKTSTPPIDLEKKYQENLLIIKEKYLGAESLSLFAQRLFEETSQLAREENLVKLDKFRQELLQLSVPSNFKTLHLNLVLGLDLLEESIKEDDANKYEEAIERLEKL